MLTPLMLLAIACAMVLAHELGHVVITHALGGRWLGVEFKGLMLGVRLSVAPLSLRQIAWTLAAGPLAEACVAVGAAALWPEDLRWWLWMLSAQWLFNLFPWGLVPNDGTRLLRLWRHGSVDAPRHR
ncbi:MAG: hypothetical protein OWU84_06105 [Firmicutes bacterium]|nr:hypothetical protein [Bacillota bacterium]